MVTPKMILNTHTLFLIKYKNRNIILKTEQTMILNAQCDRGTSYNLIKHCDDHSCYIKIALKARRNPLCAICRLPIIFSLKSLLSLVKVESLHRMESSCNIRSNLGLTLAYYSQSLPFS